MGTEDALSFHRYISAFLTGCSKSEYDRGSIRDSQNLQDLKRRDGTGWIQTEALYNAPRGEGGLLRRERFSRREG
jgi:hypothetical protein